jgi:hypothetical protein
MITCLVLAYLGEGQARARPKIHDAEEEGGAGAFAGKLAPVRQTRQAFKNAPSWRMTMTWRRSPKRAAMAMKTAATRVIRRK